MHSPQEDKALNKGSAENNAKKVLEPSMLLLSRSSLSVLNFYTAYFLLDAFTEF